MNIKGIMKKLGLLFLFVSQISFAQKNLVNECINKIEFTEDSVKSVFHWVSDNIRYDMANLDTYGINGGFENSYF